MDLDGSLCRGVGWEASCPSSLKSEDSQECRGLGALRGPGQSSWPDEIYSDNRGKVHALKKNGAICTVANHKDLRKSVILQCMVSILVGAGTLPSFLVLP